MTVITCMTQHSASLAVWVSAIISSNVREKNSKVTWCWLTLFIFKMEYSMGGKKNNNHPNIFICLDFHFKVGSMNCERRKHERLTKKNSELLHRVGKFYGESFCSEYKIYARWLNLVAGVMHPNTAVLFGCSGSYRRWSFMLAYVFIKEALHMFWITFFLLSWDFCYVTHSFECQTGSRFYSSNIKYWWRKKIIYPPWSWSFSFSCCGLGVYLPYFVPSPSFLF